MDKYINKLVDNPWFMRAVALILALLLFENVNEANKSVINVPQDQEKQTLHDVPVKSYYDTENLVITGIPETVTLTLSGPRASLQQAITQRGFEVYVDLTNAEIGEQRVPIQIRDISERLKVTIEPEFITVSVQEKVTKEFAVQAEYDKKIIAEGYIEEAPIVNPDKVTITGGKEEVDKITYVKAAVDIRGTINQTVTREAEILVLDKNLNKLNVSVNPRTVNVTIPVQALTKIVPIEVKQVGILPRGIRIESIQLETDSVEIIAPQEVLDKTSSVQVELNVSDLEEDIETTLPILMPEGVVAVNPARIGVIVDISMIEDRTFSNKSIRVKGLNEGYRLSFLEPANGETSLTISGPKEEIVEVSENNFEIYIDVFNLSIGEHEVKIHVNGPEIFNWRLGRETVKISITEIEE